VLFKMATVSTLGEKMGLNGEQLQAFIKEQQALARDERERERDLERQCLQLQREHEENKTRVELEKEANRKFELELKKSKMGDEEEPEEEVVPSNRVKGMKMTAFVEKDDIDFYDLARTSYKNLAGPVLHCCSKDYICCQLNKG